MSRAYFRGKQYEQLFMELTGATPRRPDQHNGNTKVLRENGLRAKDGLYKLVGRTPYKGRDRKDVFTYITKRDLLSIGHTLYELE